MFSWKILSVITLRIVHPLPSCHLNKMMSLDHMRQVLTPLWWLLRITQKAHDTRTQLGGNKTKHTDLNKLIIKKLIKLKLS